MVSVGLISYTVLSFIFPFQCLHFLFYASVFFKCCAGNPGLMACLTHSPFLSHPSFSIPWATHISTAGWNLAHPLSSSLLLEGKFWNHNHLVQWLSNPAWSQPCFWLTFESLSGDWVLVLFFLIEHPVVTAWPNAHRSRAKVLPGSRGSSLRPVS